MKSILRLGIDSHQRNAPGQLPPGQPQAAPVCYTVGCSSVLHHQPESTWETELKNLQKGCIHHS